MLAQASATGFCTKFLIKTSGILLDMSAAEKEKPFRGLRRPVVAKKSWFPGIGRHLDVDSYNSRGQLESHYTVTGTEKELENHIDQFNREFEKELKIALLFETSAFFFAANALKTKPPEIERAAVQVESISEILVNNAYGRRDGPSYSSLLEDVSKVTEQRKGTIALMGWNSKLLVTSDKDSEDIVLTMTADSHPVVVKRFERLAYIVGYDEGKLPIASIASWTNAFKDWEAFLKELSHNKS